MKSRKMTYIMVKEKCDVDEDATDEGAGDGHVRVLVRVDGLVVHRQVDSNVPSGKTFH